MTPVYLVDTDWVIHYLRGQPDIVRRLNETAPEGIGLAIISLAELYEGVYRASEPEQRDAELGVFLRTVTLVNLDDATCRIFGRERGRLRQAGRMVSDFDLLIGATALRHDLTLLTNNRRHFEAIEGLRLISS